MTKLTEKTNGVEKDTPTEVAVVQQRNQPMELATADINSGNLPDLSDAPVIPVDLMADYWTPERVGESKKLYFDKIAYRQVLDQGTGALLDLECAFFIDNTGNELKSLSNGSKRLVGAIVNNNIERGTPLSITYLGKKKNASNQYMSDNWSVKPIQINIQAK